MRDREGLQAIQGVYVLTDNGFRPFSRMSMASPSEAAFRAKPVWHFLQNTFGTILTSLQFLWFPCGIIRGALASMGIKAMVQAEILDIPAAVFHVKTNPPKA